jgi:hypothetical protein
MERITVAAAVLILAGTAWANPPGYGQLLTSKEATAEAIAADKAYNECILQNLQKYARTTQVPATLVVQESVRACQSERSKLLSAMRKARPNWSEDWLDKRDQVNESYETSIVIAARSE